MRVIPAKGGSCVRDLNTGTASRQSMPRISMIFCCLVPTGLVSFIAEALSAAASCPFSEKETIHTGTRQDTRLGKNRLFMMWAEVILLPIHSMIVVTSPMGVQAPPALAAMTIMLPNTHLSFCESSSFPSSVTMIMAGMQSATAAFFCCGSGFFG